MSHEIGHAFSEEAGLYRDGVQKARKELSDAMYDYAKYPGSDTMKEITQKLLQHMRQYALEEARADSFAMQAISEIFPKFGEKRMIETVFREREDNIRYLYSRYSGYFEPEGFRNYYNRALKYIQDYEYTSSYVNTAEETTKMLMEGSAAFHGSVSFGNFEDIFRPLQIEEGNKSFGQAFTNFYPRSPESPSQFFQDRLHANIKEGRIKVRFSSAQAGPTSKMGKSQPRTFSSIIKGKEIAEKVIKGRL